ncbi:hypothetical protein BH18ACI4_BH18ACI4_11930 [soil metagenome]
MTYTAMASSCRLERFLAICLANGNRIAGVYADDGGCIMLPRSKVSLNSDTNNFLTTSTGRFAGDAQETRSNYVVN